MCEHLRTQLILSVATLSTLKGKTLSFSGHAFTACNQGGFQSPPGLLLRLLLSSHPTLTSWKLSLMVPASTWILLPSFSVLCLVMSLSSLLPPCTQNVCFLSERYHHSQCWLADFSRELCNIRSGIKTHSESWHRYCTRMLVLEFYVKGTFSVLSSFGLSCIHPTLIWCQE